MTVSVWEQGRCLLGALLLGVGVGLVYDLLRGIRWRIRRRIFCGVLDLLFWVVVTVVLFFWSVAAGGGVVRLGTCLFLFLGAVIYFHLLSSLFFPVLSWFVGILAKLLHLMSLPFRQCARGLGHTAKKITVFCKKHFSFPRK